MDSLKKWVKVLDNFGARCSEELTINWHSCPIELVLSHEPWILVPTMERSTLLEGL